MFRLCKIISSKYCVGSVPTCLEDFSYIISALHVKENKELLAHEVGTIALSWCTATNW